MFTKLSHYYRIRFGNQQVTQSKGRTSEYHQFPRLSLHPLLVDHNGTK